MNITYCKQLKGIDYIGDYFLLFNRKPIHYYKVHSKEFNAFGIKKDSLNYCLSRCPELKLKFNQKSFRRYIDLIKNPIDKEIKKDIHIYNRTHDHIKFDKITVKYDV